MASKSGGGKSGGGKMIGKKGNSKSIGQTEAPF